MFWTASGEVVLMTILGGCRHADRPGAGRGHDQVHGKHPVQDQRTILHTWFAFLPDGLEDLVVTWIYPFIGKGWHLTLGIMFMLVVIFLPGGLSKAASASRRGCSAAQEGQGRTTPAKPQAPRANKETTPWEFLKSKNVNKRFGGLQALGDVNLSVQGEHRATRSSAPTGRASRPC
jgi:hypothetical protein